MREPVFSVPNITMTGPLLLKYVGFFAFGFVVPTLASIPDVYLAASGAGTQDGSSCANAKPINFFNTAASWGSASTQIGPGSTVHLCGTIVGGLGANILTFNGSGSSGSPITLKWETGALITSPACSSCIDVGGNSWVVLDGNGTSPSITNTANGSSLANHIDANAISASPCANCEFKNLTVNNMYVHSSTSDTANGFGSGVSITGSNWSVHDSTFDQMFVGIDSAYQNGDNNLSIYNNTMDHVNWGLHIGNNNTNTLSNVFIHDNHVKNMDNWDTTTDAFHHDGFFVVQNNPAASISDVYFYNNLFDGSMSSCSPNTCATAWIYFNTALNGIYVFNNVFSGTNTSYSIECCISGDQNISIFNNFFQGTSGFNGTGAVGFSFENNAMNGAYTYLTANGFSGTVNVNDNTYDTVGSNSGHAFKWNGGGGQTWAQFKASNPTFDTHSSTTNDFKVNTSFQPLPGSPLTGAAANLRCPRHCAT